MLFPEIEAVFRLLADRKRVLLKIGAKYLSYDIVPRIMSCIGPGHLIR
jgi:hypothetical protein